MSLKYNFRFCMIFFLFFMAGIVKVMSQIKFEGSEHASIGIYISEISSNKIIADYNSGKALIPASILKTVTSATALETLGPEFRYHTDFLVTRSIDDKTPRDIIVVGAADPTTGSREFKYTSSVLDSVVENLKRIGLYSLEGGVEINNDVLPEGGGIIGKWEVEDITESYGAGLFAVNWLDNYFEPDYVIPSPPDYFSEQLMSKMAYAGIDAMGTRNDEEAVPIDTTAVDTVLVYRYFSPTLNDIMHAMMVKSHNLMAEGVLRAIKPGETREAAIEAELTHWNNKGIDLKYSNILDGSGLARGNTITPSQIGRILTSMARSKLSGEYVSLFPKAGREGTVKNFLAKTRLAGRMAVKSGSMGGVHCYAGYRLDNAGKPTHTVVVMVNNFFCQRTKVKKAIEQYLLQILP